MAIEKLHNEFHNISMEEGWEKICGYPAGIQHKILSGHLNEDSKCGSRTRLLRIEAGVHTSAPVCHDYWEEVYLLSGDLVVGSDVDGHGGTKFISPTYACRPPGVDHGPFKSNEGCLLLEIHYYDPA